MVAQGSVSCPPSISRSSSSVGSGVWPTGRRAGTGHPPSCAHGTQLGDWASGDGDRELLAGLGAPQHLPTCCELFWEWSPSKDGSNSATTGLYNGG